MCNTISSRLTIWRPSSRQVESAYYFKTWKEPRVVLGRKFYWNLSNNRKFHSVALTLWEQRRAVKANMQFVCMHSTRFRYWKSLRVPFRTISIGHWCTCAIYLLWIGCICCILDACMETQRKWLHTVIKHIKKNKQKQNDSTRGIVHWSLERISISMWLRIVCPVV